MTTKMNSKKDTPQTRTKKLVVIRGRGTTSEQRIETNVTLYWSNTLGWVTVPADDDRM